jgi:hypothetical protein
LTHQARPSRVVFASPSIAGNNRAWIVMDGQPRKTSLYAAKLSLPDNTGRYRANFGSSGRLNRRSRHRNGELVIFSH